MFQLAPIAPCPISGSHREEPGSVLLTLTLLIFAQELAGLIAIGVIGAARTGSLLDLLPENREGLVGNMAIGGCLGHSDHEAVEFAIFEGRLQAAHGTS